MVGVHFSRSRWQKKTICFHCDNAAIVAIIQGRYSKDWHMVHMIRCLFFLEAKFQFSFISVHVPGVLNTVAYALLRNNIMVTFSALAPQAHSQPVLVPHAVINGVISQRPWSSLHWMYWFTSTCSLSKLPALSVCMAQP